MTGRSIDEIQGRIDGRTAKVMTASEFKGLPEGERRSVDVVTCGTFGIMSGTMAILTVPVASPGTFKRADSITINGVRGSVGPCPNESLGLVDCIFHGTAHRDRSYGGGHLFKDMVAGKPLDVVVESDGATYGRTVTLDDIPFARMVLTRGAFKNYTGFVNGSDSEYATIFSGPEPMGPGLSEASVSGCGSINPLQNDPGMRFIHHGASALLNGAPGMVLGTGTRSSEEKPNLSIEADMHRMDADYMGGFRTSAGPECLTSVAVAIPMTCDGAFSDASVTDADSKLPLADVRDRRPVFTDSYASVWDGTDHTVSSDLDNCIHCDGCSADSVCPVDADPSKGIDPDRCMSCGLCVRACPGNVFSAHLGSVSYGDREVPITVRQSSRDKAERLCSILKEDIEDGNWSLRCFDGRL